MVTDATSRWSLWPQDLRSRRLHKAKSATSLGPLNVSTAGPPSPPLNTMPKSAAQLPLSTPRSVVFTSHEAMTAALEQEVVRNCPRRSSSFAVEPPIVSPVSGATSPAMNAIRESRNIRTVSQSTPVELPGSILLEGKGYEPASEYSILHWGRGPEKYDADFLNELGFTFPEGSAPAELAAVERSQSPRKDRSGRRVSSINTASLHDSAIGTPNLSSPESMHAVDSPTVSRRRAKRTSSGGSIDSSRQCLYIPHNVSPVDVISNAAAPSDANSLREEAQDQITDMNPPSGSRKPDPSEPKDATRPKSAISRISKVDCTRVRIVDIKSSSPKAKKASASPASSSSNSSRGSSRASSLSTDGIKLPSLSETGPSNLLETILNVQSPVPDHSTQFPATPQLERIRTVDSLNARVAELEKELEERNAEKSSADKAVQAGTTLEELEHRHAQRIAVLRTMVAYLDDARLRLPDVESYKRVRKALKIWGLIGPDEANNDTNSTDYSSVSNAHRRRLAASANAVFSPPIQAEVDMLTHWRSQATELEATRASKAEAHNEIASLRSQLDSWLIKERNRNAELNEYKRTITEIEETFDRFGADKKGSSSRSIVDRITSMQKSLEKRDKYISEMENKHTSEATNLRLVNEQKRREIIEHYELRIGVLKHAHESHQDDELDKLKDACSAKDQEIQRLKQELQASRGLSPASPAASEGFKRSPQPSLRSKFSTQTLNQSANLSPTSNHFPIHEGTVEYQSLFRDLEALKAKQVY